MNPAVRKELSIFPVRQEDGVNIWGTWVSWENEEDGSANEFP